MATHEEIADTLSGFALFADLTEPQVRAVAEIFEEVSFQAGDRVLRQGISGGAFYVILDGSATVAVDGIERTELPRGDFFGEVSILLGETPSADVVAKGPLRCMVLPGQQVEQFLITYPRVMYRMLQVQARRIRKANQWRS